MSSQISNRERLDLILNNLMAWYQYIPGRWEELSPRRIIKIREPLLNFRNHCKHELSQDYGDPILVGCIVKEFYSLLKKVKYFPHKIRDGGNGEEILLKDGLASVEVLMGEDRWIIKNAELIIECYEAFCDFIRDLLKEFPKKQPDEWRSDRDKMPGHHLKMEVQTPFTIAMFKRSLTDFLNLILAMRPRLSDGQRNFLTRSFVRALHRISPLNFVRFLGRIGPEFRLRWGEREIDSVWNYGTRLNSWSEQFQFAYFDIALEERWTVVRTLKELIEDFLDDIEA